MKVIYPMGTWVIVLKYNIDLIQDISISNDECMPKHNGFIKLETERLP